MKTNLHIFKKVLITIIVLSLQFIIIFPLNAFYKRIVRNDDKADLYAKLNTATITISGTLFMDINGLLDNKVNGLPLVISELITLLDDEIVYPFELALVDAGNDQIIALTTADKSNGQYSFQNVSYNANGYKVIIVDGYYNYKVGDVLTEASYPVPRDSNYHDAINLLSASWHGTGERLGQTQSSDGTPDGIINIPASMLTTDISYADFGLHKDPTPLNGEAGMATEPLVGDMFPLDGSTELPPLGAIGNSYENYEGINLSNTSRSIIDYSIDSYVNPTALASGISNKGFFVIETLPLNGELYYKDNLVKAGDNISTNDLPNLKYKFVGSGWTNDNFYYGYIDALGYHSRQSRLYSISIPYSLPIHYAKSLSGMVENDIVNLSWATASEIINKGFVIERSSNLSTWDSIGFTKSISLNGNSNGLLNYSFKDINPNSNVNYYRLKQVDMDGHFAYSNIVSLSLPTGLAVKVYPNPADTYIDVTNIAIGSQIRIFGFEGKIYKTIKTNKQPQEISLTGMTSGVYFIQILDTNGKIIQTSKFVKK